MKEEKNFTAPNATCLFPVIVEDQNMKVNAKELCIVKNVERNSNIEKHFSNISKKNIRLLQKNILVSNVIRCTMFIILFIYT